MNTNGWMKSLIMLANSDDMQHNGTITVIDTLPVIVIDDYLSIRHM